MRHSLAHFIVCMGSALVAVNGIEVGEPCLNSDYCQVTTTNSWCYKQFVNCVRGVCRCMEDYYLDGNVCKRMVYSGEPCNANKFCMGGASCTAGTCQCQPSYTWNTKLDMCIPTVQKAIGDTCLSNFDCFEGALEAECVADIGTKTPRYCRCRYGFITHMHTCRSPHVDQSCSSISCARQIDVTELLTSSGQVTETCQSGTCKCPSTAKDVTIQDHGETNHICQLRDTSQAGIGDGVWCESSKTCKSHFCAKCPGEPTSICVTQVQSKAASASMLVWTWLVPVLLSSGRL